MKIRTKLFVCFTGFSLVIIFAFICLFYFSMTLYFEKNAGEHLEEKVTHVAQTIDRHMLARVRDLNVLSNNPLFHTSTINSISDYLSNIVSEYPFYDELFFVNKEGIIISSSNRLMVGKNILDLEPDIIQEFHKAINGEVSDVYISDISKVSQKELEQGDLLDIELLSGIVDETGSKLGVLVGFVNLKFITDLVFHLEEHTVGREYAYLVNDPGEVIITRDNTVKLLAPHPDLQIENLQQKLEGDEYGYLIYESSKEIKVISGYADLAEYGTDRVGDWSLLVVIPYKDVMAPVYRMMLQSFYVFLVLLAGIIILVILLSRNLSNPIILLKDAVEEVGKGNLTKVEIRTKDEIGELSTAFNTMSERLDQSTTEKKELKKKLQQSQKMEAIGTLAGGIAHDFNNILTAIFGNVELAKIKADKSNPLNEHISSIGKSAIRAKDLVDQILTFSRKTEKEKYPLRVELVLEEAIKLLRSSIPTTIEITKDINSQGTVLADPTQLHQVIMNLCTNAYHAMREKGGLLGVSLKEVAITSDDIAMGLELNPGKYLQLEVSDTGCGMNQETKDKIFDPYFTTKEHGGGTGLGLAVVHGIVKGHNGHITVYSEPSQGTTFHVYLPLSEEDAITVKIISETEHLAGGSEHIMFVDDEEKNASVAKEILSKQGYQVDIFTNGVQAWQEFQKQPDGYDLVITDMTMPFMDGAELAQKILEIRPSLPIILCTGYSEMINREKSLAMGISEYLQKPMAMSMLAKSVRQTLDKRKEPIS